MIYVEMKRSENGITIDSLTGSLTQEITRRVGCHEIITISLKIPNILHYKASKNYTVLTSLTC